MKAFTAMLLFTFALHTKQQVTPDPYFLGYLRENQTICAKETGVETSDAAIIWTNPSAPATNKPLKCYYTCLCEKLGIIDNNGTVYDNVDSMKFFAQYDDPSNIKEIGDECKAITAGTEECDFGYQIFKCVAQAQLD